MSDTELIPRITVAQMVDAYTAACESLDQAYEILHQAQSRLNATFGDYGPDVWHTSSAHYDHQRSRDQVKTDMLKTAWRRILAHLDLDKVCTEKKAEEIRKRIEENPPPLTAEEVAAVLTAWIENRQQFAQDYLDEVYKLLRPEGCYSGKLKTNQTPGIGRKVILGWKVEHKPWGGGFKVNYGRSEDELHRIEQAMYHLDGQHSELEHGSHLVNAINASGNSGEGETDYFRFRACHNGNLHLEFKHPDLTAKLDRLFGGLTVKPGKRVYNQSQFV